MTKRATYEFYGGHAGLNSVSEEDCSLPLREVWKKEVLQVESVIFASETHLIVLTLGLKGRKVLAKILAFSRDKGELCWEFEHIEEAHLSLWGGGTCVYRDIVVTEIRREGKVIAIREGKQIWETEIKYAGAIGHYDNEIMFDAADGIYFLAPETGDVIRKYPVNYAKTSTFNHKVVVSYSQDDHVLLCFDRKNGALLWSTDIEELAKTWGARASIACRAPVIVGDRLYIAVGSRIACFDLNSGKLLWRNPDCDLKSVVYRNGRLYGIDTNGYFCFDAATGEVIQKRKYLEAVYGNSLPFMAGKYLFCTGPRLVAIDTDTGEEVWVKEDKRKTHYFDGQPIFLDGCLYTADNKGYLYCFGNS